MLWRETHKSLFQFAHSVRGFLGLEMQWVRCRKFLLRLGGCEPLIVKLSGLLDWADSRRFGFVPDPFCASRSAQEGSTDGVVGN